MLKFLGGMFLMIGAVVGGGILAIPIVSAKVGFLATFLFIVTAWVIMTKTGLDILALSLSCPEKYNSYYSIVGKFLGDKTQVITIFLFLWLLYFSLASYISGCVSLIMSHVHVTHPLWSYFNISLLYVALLGGLITVSTKLIIRMNVFLVTAKLVLLCAVIACSYPLASNFSAGSLTWHQTGAFSIFIIIINAFGFQFIIPSLVSYYGRDNHAVFKHMLLASTTTVLILYLAWLYTIYALIPLQGEHGLLSIYHSSNQLLAFNSSLNFFMHSTWVTRVLSCFETVALFGSFLCVSLGVFDFLVDVFKANKRFGIGLMTFLPPLFISLLSENMYVQAMSAAGYIAIVLEIVIPIMARRKQKKSMAMQAQEKLKPCLV